MDGKEKKEITKKNGISIRIAAVAMAAAIVVSSVTAYQITKNLRNEDGQSLSSLTGTVVLTEADQLNSQLFDVQTNADLVEINTKIQEEQDAVDYSDVPLTAASAPEDDASLSEEDAVQANDAVSSHVQIKNYLNSMSVKEQIYIEDTQDYRNSVNGMFEVPTDGKLVTDECLITKRSKVEDKDFDILKKGISRMPAASGSAVIFPGAIIRADESMAYGHPSSVNLEQGSGTFTINGGAVKNGDTDISVDTISKEAIESQLIQRLASSADPLVVSICTVTSPEQASLELGIPADDIRGLLDGQWQDIYSGKKTVALVALRKDVCSVSLADNLYDVSSLLADNVTLEQVKSEISEERPAAYVASVQYGREYLLSCTLNNDTAYNPRSANGFADVPQLEKGLSILLQSRSSEMNGAMRMALSYADMTLYTLGGNGSWSAPEKTNLDDLTKRMIADQTTDPAEAPLIPLSYVAQTLGGVQHIMNLRVNADKYEMCAVESVKCSEFYCHEGADWVSTENEIKKAWGLDLNKFNNTNEIAEYTYINENNTSKSRQSESVPAFKCVFGLLADAEALSCTCRGYCADRIVHGGIYFGNCSGSPVRHDGEETGPVDISKPVYAYTKDASRDCYFCVNGIEYGGVNGRGNGGSNVVVHRNWDKETNGAGLSKNNVMNSVFKDS